MQSHSAVLSTPASLIGLSEYGATKCVGLWATEYTNAVSAAFACSTCGSIDFIDQVATHSTSCNSTETLREKTFGKIAHKTIFPIWYSTSMDCLPCSSPEHRPQRGRSGCTVLVSACVAESERTQAYLLSMVSGAETHRRTLARPQ